MLIASTPWDAIYITTEGGGAVVLITQMVNYMYSKPYDDIIRASLFYMVQRSHIPYNMSILYYEYNCIPQHGCSTAAWLHNWTSGCVAGYMTCYTTG